jgi:hypothetical protein
MNPAASLPFPANAPTAAGTRTDADEDSSGDLVTVTRVFNSLEAEMLRGCLQAEGIPATLGDAQTIQTDTLLTLALGGIRVMVPATFADAARLTVDAFERGALEIDELPADAEAAVPETETTSEIKLSHVGWLVLALVAVAVVFV